MIGRRDDAPRGWLQRLRVPRRQGGEDVAALRRQNAALMEEVGELTQAQRSGRPVSVALMDIDDFKAFNDSRGHQAGDRLLVAAAAAWQAQLREGDLLCRWGGDEFAALLPDCSEGAAHEIIARVTSTTPGLQSCAAGVVAWDGAETSDELVWRADVELLKRKRARVQSAP